MNERPPNVPATVPERTPDTPVESLNSEDIITLRPSKPMTVREILAEAEQQGLRPLTLEEVEAFVKGKQEVHIEPKDTDIQGDYTVAGEESKQS